MDLLTTDGGGATLRSVNIFYAVTHLRLTNNSNHANAYRASYDKR